MSYETEAEDRADMLQARVTELEALLEDRNATIASYRLREFNRQAEREAGRREPLRCQSVSPAGTACELDTGHDAPHVRHGDGVVRKWGGS